MALAACVSTQAPSQQAVRRIDPTYVAMYGARPDEPYPLPATDISEVDPQFLRREVAYYGREEPGTIVVDTQHRYLYLVREGGRAIRYGIGVGKRGPGLERPRPDRPQGRLADAGPRPPT